MANWGLMMGIGQGLQQVGGMLETRSKAQLADKLSQEKEVRDAAREQKKFERDQLTFSNTGLKQDSEGVLWEVDYAKNGSELDKRLASPDKLENFNLDRKKAKTSLEADMLKADLSRKQLADYDADKALSRELTQARIGQARDTGLAAVMRAGNSGSGGTSGNQPAGPSQAAEVLTTSYKDLIKSYTTGDTPSLSVSEVEEIANKAVRAAALQKVDAATLFRDELERAAAGRREGASQFNFR